MEVTERKNEGKQICEREAWIAEHFDELSEEVIFAFMKKRMEDLGRMPEKSDFPMLMFKLKGKYGPWPRVLEAARLKPVSPTRLKRQENARKKWKRKHEAHKKAAGSESDV